MKFFQSKRLSFLSLTLFFAIVTFVSFTRCLIAFKTGQYGVTPSMGFLEARKTLGGLDAGSYLQGALSLKNGTYANPQYSFIWQLWPPGLPLVELASLQFFGLTGHPLVISAVISSLLVAAMLSLFILNLKSSRYKVVVITISVIVFLSSAVQGWLLDQGIMYAEGFYIFLTILALHLTKRANAGGRLWIWFAAGLFFGFAAYFRATGYTTLVVISVLGVFFILGNCLKSRRITPKKSVFENLKSSSTVLLVGIAGIFVTLFWAIFRATWTNLGVFQWVTTGDNSWAMYWKTDKELRDSGWGITAGVDNWACHLDTKTCELLANHKINNPDYLSLSVRTILNHPISFFGDRIGNFWDYWSLNGRWLYPPQNKLPAAFAVTEGIIFLIIAIMAVITILFILKTSPRLGLIQLSTLLGSTVPLVVYHLEARYFIPCKIFSAFILVQNLHVLRFPHFQLWKRLRR